ncbi:hypothetical protein NM952_07290 [Pasteurella multocida subsp. multocida]|uniref:Uncharacterized protein n=1 Tax=Pasteurella multocida TaxID=747 RepID=A0A9X3UM67_PASMD|nr:hypothetical protein [Pasteurella multocida]MBF6979429.1 hypothetical protein [Pasteurella multocida]MBF6984593.1 hypothetical protein [Pasteurella multocida]MDA5609543.1 hypothetical protein [Pasteurella multocida]MDA5612172.1 hypothetical protein [Pasteurella multocida]MDA5618401.1 hypothetical protein [Pasteurella multocida subsp. multocida]
MMNGEYQKQILDYIERYLLRYAHWKGIFPSMFSEEIFQYFERNEMDIFSNTSYSLLSSNTYIESLVFEHVNRYLYKNYQDSIIFEKDLAIDIKTMIATSNAVIQRPSIRKPTESIQGFDEPSIENNYARIARFERELALNKLWETTNMKGGIVFEGLLPSRLEINPLLPNAESTHHIWTNTFFENKPFIQGFYGNMNSIEVPYVLWMNSELLTILELEPDDYRNGLQALNKCNEVILQFRTWRSKLIDKGASFGINSNIAKLEGCDLLLRKSYYERLKSIIPNLVFYTYIMKN